METRKWSEVMMTESGKHISQDKTRAWVQGKSIFGFAIEEFRRKKLDDERTLFQGRWSPDDAQAATRRSNKAAPRRIANQSGLTWRRPG